MRLVVQLVVDSVAGPVRTKFDRSHLRARQTLLSELSSALKHLAEIFRFPVVVTNQTTHVGFQSPSEPNCHDRGGDYSAALGRFHNCLTSSFSALKLKRLRRYRLVSRCEHTVAAKHRQVFRLFQFHRDNGCTGDIRKVDWNQELVCR